MCTRKIKINICLIMSLVALFTGSAGAWNSGYDFSEVQGGNNWQYGYMDSNDTFNQFHDFGDHYYSNMTSWFEVNDRGTQCQIADISFLTNSDFWGSYYVAMPHKTYLCQRNTNGEKACLRWKAPTTGIYTIDVNFSGAIYSPGVFVVPLTNSNVFVIKNNSTILFSGYVEGFAGGNGRNPIGVHPTAVYSNSLLSMNANDTLDFVQKERGGTGNDIVMADIKISAVTTPVTVQFPIYVSPDGNDTNTGSESSPFATIAHAQETLRLYMYYNNGLSDDVKIYLRGGTYYLSTPLRFTPLDSDPAGHKISYENYPGENPVISGGVRLTGWAAVGNNKYTVTLPDVSTGKWWFRQLWSGDQRCPRSRWPNSPSDALNITAVSTDMKTMTVGVSVQGSNLSANGTEAVMYSAWTAARARCASKSGNSVTTEAVCGAVGGYPVVDTHELLFFENNPDYIDQDGEWHLSPSTGVLTYKSPSGINPADCIMIVPKLARLIKIDGPVNNLVFNGITFKHTTWEYPKGMGYGEYGSGFWVWDVNALPMHSIPAAVQCRWTTNCEFKRCCFGNIGTTAVGFAEGCEDNIISDCKFYDIGGNAVTVGWTGSENQKDGFRFWASNDVPRNHNILNNYIASPGQDWLGCVGIAEFKSTDTLISNNIMHHTPYGGVTSTHSQVSENQTQEGPCNMIENHLYDIKYLLHDGGGLYANQNQQGTQMIGNLIHDVHWGINSYYDWSVQAGIYWDNGCSNISMNGNLTYNIAHFDFHENTTDTYENRTYGINHFNEPPAGWGTTEQAIAAAAGTKPNAPLNLTLTMSGSDIIVTGSAEAWAVIHSAVIQQDGSNVASNIIVEENGAIHGTILSFAYSTDTITLQVTVSDPDGHVSSLGVSNTIIIKEWNSALDYTGTQPSKNWSYGYRDSTGTFTQFPDFGDHYYMGMSGWMINSSMQTQCISNQDSIAHEAEFWGSYYYAEPNSTYLAQTNSVVQRATYRWTVPQDGKYKVDANFSGVIYSGGQTDCNVCIEVSNNSLKTSIFNDYISGFVGGGGYAASGTKPSATYSGILTLKAGDTIDFFQTNRVVGNDITGFLCTINRDDGIIDYNDLFILALHWLNTNCVSPSWCDGADIDKNKRVDLKDFADLAQYWLETTTP